MEMNRKPQSPKRGKLDLAAVKWLIIALSLSAIMLFWNLFSRQAYPDAISAAPLITETPSQPAPVLMLDLPPIPTLVPTSTESMNLDPLPSPTPSSVNIPQPAAQTPAKIFLGGAKPQAKKSAPAPVTKTRSSK
jgi:hypothetical protein